MTESRFDVRQRWGRALSFWVGVLATTACHPGLPPEPPGRDAADPKAKATGYEPTANVYETSAFEGAKMQAPTGHKHHHGKASKEAPAKDATDEQPEPMKMPMDHKMPKETP